VHETDPRSADLAAGTPIDAATIGPAAPSTGARPHPSWAERYGDGRGADGEGLWEGFDNGWVMVSELVAATFTWGGIGWLLDRWLGLAPLLMSLGFILGFSAGFYLLWARSTGRIVTRSRRTTEVER
jgi:hypothetical protein